MFPLGSFWVTPGLRTTANRFVINLLVVNIVGCLALTPALWLHGGLVPTVHNEIQSIYDSKNSVVEDVVATTTGSSTTASTIFVEIISNGNNYENDDVEVIAEVHEDEPSTTTIQNHQVTNHSTTVINDSGWSPTKNVQYSDCTRFWGNDLVAALGK